MSKPIICFLDFDGVTHTFGAFIKNYFECLPVIEDVLRAFPEVQIAISSDWRKAHPLDVLRTPFSPDIRARVIGVTPASSFRAYGNGIRFAEAQAFLRENNLDSERWVALDDIKENWVNPATGDIDARLICCPDGFWDEEAALLTQTLLLMVDKG